MDRQAHIYLSQKKAKLAVNKETTSAITPTQQFQTPSTRQATGYQVYTNSRFTNPRQNAHTRAPPRYNNEANRMDRTPAQIDSSGRDPIVPQQQLKNTARQDPTSIGPFCAWCFSNGQRHNHTTLECHFFKNGNAHDQWQVIREQRVCAACLEGIHPIITCPRVISKESPRCSTCNYTHCQPLPCKPPTQ